MNMDRFTEERDDLSYIDKREEENIEREEMAYEDSVEKELGI